MLENGATLSVSEIKKDFPILQTSNRGKPLIYLDNASSTQKPLAVVNSIAHFYLADYANIHRGIYELSERATHLYEATREKVRDFIHARAVEEIVFVKGTTEAINLVAQTFGKAHLQAGDEIIVSEMEHHSNIVPWMLLRDQIGINIKVLPVKDNGELDLVSYQKLFTPRTKLVALTHVSNVLGTINPIKEMVAIAREHKAFVLIDGAQAVSHLPVNMQELDCDFYAFSAHKMYGPTGIGILYAKQALLEHMPPYQGGGDMIETVSFTKVTYTKAPQKFEAGTPHIAGVVGLSAALDYLRNINLQAIYAHEQTLLQEAMDKLAMIPGLKIIGTAPEKLGVISFVLEHIHPHDVGTVLDHEGIAIRAGHHCAMPLIERYKVPAMVRASLGIYNTSEDIDALVAGIQLATRIFS